ncbi:hypothetical protein D3C73_1605920 [compost metagenome]
MIGAHERYAGTIHQHFDNQANIGLSIVEGPALKDVAVQPRDFTLVFGSQRGGHAIHRAFTGTGRQFRRRGS